MRLLFVLEHYLPHLGGVEVVFSNLCEGLVKQGHEVKLITTRLKGTAPEEEINGVKIRRVSCPNRYFFTLLSLPLIWKISKTADILHTTTFNAALPAWIVVKLRRKPIVITVHEIFGAMWPRMESNWIAAKLHQWYERLLISLSFDCFVCVSQYTKNCLKIYKNIPDNKLRVIYNGFDYDFWDPAKYSPRRVGEAQFVYLFFGRPGISKGIFDLIKAVPQVQRAIPKSQLVMLLSCDPKRIYQKILKLIQRLNLTNSIKILDPVAREELPSYLLGADCIVIPSLTEGFGFAALEGCALGTPMVITDTAALPEVVFGKVNFVQPGNFKSIAQGIIKVYKKEWENLSEKKFTQEKNVQEYLNLYLDLLQKNENLSNQSI